MGIVLFKPRLAMKPHPRLGHIFFIVQGLHDFNVELYIPYEKLKDFSSKSFHDFREKHRHDYVHLRRFAYELWANLRTRLWTCKAIARFGDDTVLRTQTPLTDQDYELCDLLWDVLEKLQFLCGNLILTKREP